MNRIKELRLEKGLTQKDLAEKLKVAQNTLSYWETDKSSPDKDSLIALAEILECSIDYLLGRDDNVFKYTQIPENMASTMAKLNNLPTEKMKEGFIKTNNPIKKLYGHTGIAEKLIYLREKNNLTINELAENLNDILPSNAKINSSTLECWEDKLAMPYVGDLRALSEFYGVSINYLIGSGATISGEYKTILSSPPSFHDVLTHLYFENKLDKAQFYGLLYETLNMAIFPYSIIKNNAEELKALNLNKYGIKKRDLVKAEELLIKMREDSLQSLQIIEKQMKWEAQHKWESVITLAEKYNIKPTEIIEWIENNYPLEVEKDK